MKREFKVFKCKKCGATIISFQESSTEECELMCCGDNMEELIPNSVDASFEKHVPTYEILDNVVKARVNHVMEQEHYIEWIAYVTKDAHNIRHFEPYMLAEEEFEYIPNSKLYAYCNKHGLWKSEVK